MKRFAFILAVLLFGLVDSVQAEGRLPVYVSILPQQYFLEKVGGELVDVSVMVLPGASPATYEPTPKQMAGLARAKAYFSIGAPFESSWLERIQAANSQMTVFATDAGIPKIPMVEHDHHHGGHSATHEDEEILDPHIWLSPELVRKVARNTYAGLVKLDPVNKTKYQANLDSFLAEVEQLDGDIRKELIEVPGNKRSFMVFHPSWGYFAKHFGLNQVAIESEGKSPGPRELAEIIEHGRELGVNVVFVQPQFSAKSAKVIASEVGAQVVPLDPLSRDWEQNMRKAAKAFRDALR